MFFFTLANAPPSEVIIAGEKDVLEYTSTSYYCSSDGFPVPTVM